MKFTLSLSPNYVQDWTAEHAIREFVQNALDQQTDEHPALIKSSAGCLIVENPQSILEHSTLLLGGGTKSDDDSAIGGFGEGYKIALLVLTRLGFGVHIANYGLGELWEPEISHSFEYKTDVLSINCNPLKHGADIERGVSVIITNPQTNFDSLLQNIYLEHREHTVISESDYGTVLDPSTESGRIYIGGLFITQSDQFKYGYNFNPGILTVGRDRNLTDTFNIKYYAGNYMFRKLLPEYIPQLLIDLEDRIADLEYMDKWAMPNGMKELIQFKYADKQVITTESDKQILSDAGITLSNPIVVPSVIRDSVWSSLEGGGKPIKRKSTKELLGEFLEDEQSNLTTEQYDRLYSIYERD